MTSDDLTPDQCSAIQARVRSQQVYFDRLLARMDAQNFPSGDPMRREVTAIRDALCSLWMKLHYLQCAH